MTRTCRIGFVVIALVTVGAANAASVRGTVELTGNTFVSSTQTDPAQVFVERERQAGLSSQRGEVAVDWVAGTMRGRQFSKYQDGSLGALGTHALAEAEARLEAVPVVPGSPSPALLDLTMELDGVFNFSNLSPPLGTAGANNLRASIVGSSGGFTFAQVEYLYSWDLSGASQGVVHIGSGSTPGCSGCSFEVVHGTESVNGFQGTMLHLRVPMPVGSAFDFQFTVSSFANANASGSGGTFDAIGEWDQTAKLGYVLSDGYRLLDDDGRDLSSWNIAPVPVPAALPLLGGGLAGLCCVRRSRRAIPSAGGRSAAGRHNPVR